MKVLYESKVPSKFNIFVAITAVLSFSIVAALVYALSNDLSLTLFASAVASLGSGLYGVYVVRLVIAPRVKGLKITDKKIFLPKRNAEQVGRESYPLSDIKIKYFSGNFLLMEFKDRECTAVMTYEKKSVGEAFAKALGKSEEE
jgi:hypothetical protein